MRSGVRDCGVGTGENPPSVAWCLTMNVLGQRRLPKYVFSLSYGETSLSDGKSIWRTCRGLMEG